ncbi:hypothetical protein ACIGO9_25405 [Nocardia asteroides]|uniref:hypothetical protein n=1 Tax=Nocardia asteroides TaxID=1824 RepID=UPI0037C65480
MAVVAQVLAGASGLIILAVVGLVTYEAVVLLTEPPDPDVPPFRFLSGVFLLFTAVVAGAIGAMNLIGLARLRRRRRSGRRLVILAAPLAIAVTILSGGLKVPPVALAMIVLFTATLTATALPGTGRWILAKPPVPEPAWPAL